MSPPPSTARTAGSGTGGAGAHILTADEFPEDLVLGIMAHLDLADRHVVRRTCRRFKEIHDSSAELRYLERLARHALRPGPALRAETVFRPGPNRPRPPGTIVAHAAPHVRVAVTAGSTRLGLPDPRSDTPLPPLPVPGRAPPLVAAEKLERLRAREARWDGMNPATTRAMRIEAALGPGAVMNGGALMIKFGDGHAPITITPLPSAVNPELATPPLVGRSAYFPEIGAEERVAMDPEQDLLVVTSKGPGGIMYHGPLSDVDLSTLTTANMEQRMKAIGLSSILHVHIATLGMEPHPLAAVHDLTGPMCTMPRDPLSLEQLHSSAERRQITGMRVEDVRVLGSTVAVLVAWYNEADPHRYVVPALLLWNWKTGVKFGYHVGHICAPGEAEAFTLLTERTAMFVNPPTATRRFTLSVVTFPLSLDKGDYAANPHEWYLQQGVCVAELELPRTSPRAMIRHVQISAPRTGAATRATGGAPFTPDPDRGVVRISFIDIGTPSGRYACYELFVLREYLVDIAKRGEERVSGPMFLVPDEDELRAKRACPGLGCKCPGWKGGEIDARAGHGFRNVPFQPGDDVWTSEDERGRVFSSSDAELVFRHYAWAAWGPKHTRIKLHNDGPPGAYGRTDRTLSTAGYRDAIVFREKGTTYLQIRDFAPGRLAEFQARVEEAKRTGKVAALGSGPDCPGCGDPNCKGTHYRVEDTQFLFGAPPDLTGSLNERTTLDPAQYPTWAETVLTQLVCVQSERRVAMPLTGPDVGIRWVMLDDQRVIVGTSSRMDEHASGVDNMGAKGVPLQLYRTDLVVMCM